MIAFTILGLLVFWWLCFELGYGLGWLLEHPGLVAAVFGVFATITGIERAVDDIVAMVSVREADHG